MSEPVPLPCLRVSTGARLHFGLLANRSPAGRWFGGAGAMLADPGWVISARPAAHTTFAGPPEACVRLADFVARYAGAVPNIVLPALHWSVEQCLPEHAGLGAGTQLGMAVAAILARLTGDSAQSPETLARRVGRGARSALGLHGFFAGGLLVDGGKSHAAAPGAIVARAPFPDPWRFLLLTRPRAQGLSGAAERATFADHPPLPADTGARLCEVLLRELVPAVLEADFSCAAHALGEFGRTIGAYFAPVQGGIVSDPRMARLLEAALARGFEGASQSSWGPTIFVLCRDAEEAGQLRSDLLRGSAEPVEAHIVQVRNHGAAWTEVSDPQFPGTS